MSRLTLSPESPEGQYQDHHGVTEGEGESHYHHLFPSPKCRSLFLNPPGSLLVLLHLLLAQRLPSTPRICFPNPAMLPVQGVVRTKLDISAEYEDTDDGAAGEDKEELVPRLLVKDVSKGWKLIEHFVNGLDSLVSCP